MPKNIVQDVVPAGRRRSIRDIPIDERPNHYSNLEEVPRHSHRETPPEEDDSYEEEEAPKKGSISKWILWAIGIISVAILIVVISNTFYSATVTLTPKSKAESINLNLTASSKPIVGDLGYTVFSLVREKELSVPADAEQFVETRATGKIIIYNSFSTASQRLVKNTRFETPKGLIYKIQDSITIPGKTVIDGKTVPGSIEAVVTAESAGEEYNIGLSDFTVPGFKTNYERYLNFYAKSKTPMTGGQAGNEKTISEAKDLETRTTLDKQLLDGVLAEAKDYAVGDLIFYPQAYRIEFEPVASANDANQNNVTIKERAKFTAYIFSKPDISKAVAKKTVDNFDGSVVDAIGVESLSFQLDNDASSADSLVFKLKGDTQIVWQIDASKISSQLIDKDKSELAQVISTNSAIAKANAVIRPFWKSTFPPGPNKIKVDIVKPAK